MIRGLVRAELMAVRGNSAAAPLLAGLVLFVALISAASMSGRDAAGLGSDEATRELLAVGGRVSVLLALACGIFAVAGRRMRAALPQLVLAAPARWPIVLAGALVQALAGAMLAAAAVLTALIVAVAGMVARGTGVELAGAPVADALIGFPLAGASFAAIGVGLGTLLRDAAGRFAWGVALVWGLMWVAVADPVPVALPAIGRFLPAGALNALVGAPVEGMLATDTAALLLAVYAALAVAGAVALLDRRDLAEEASS